MSRCSILVVCTGNICRSPVGEAVLSKALGSLPLSLSSAGTHAALGRPAAPETDAFVRRELGVSLDHTARQLTREIAESSDLVITMTSEHRAWVARTAPRVTRRAFTLLELDTILALLPSTERFESLPDLTAAASRLRARAKTAGRPVDIFDPYGGQAEGYEESFRLVKEASERVARRVTDLISTPLEGDRA